MRALTPLQMKRADRYATGTIGIQSLVLMENAASAVVRHIADHCGWISGKSCAVFAGRGNNGGDALAIARRLKNLDVDVTVFVTDAPEILSSDALVNFNINENSGIRQINLHSTFDRMSVENCVLKADFIVDGIFGTGFKGEMDEVSRKAADIINENKKCTISVDLPSGLDGLTGEAAQGCVRADLTVTFQLPKVGMLIKDGPDACGKIEIADISIPESAIAQAGGPEIFFTEEAEVRVSLPERKSDSHKGDYGRVLLVTGSPGMTGAGCLCAEAAMRSGSGLVYAAVPADLAYIYAETMRELVVLPVDGWEPEPVLAKLKSATACAAGPGMGTGRAAAEIVRKVILESTVPLILDADALNIIAQDVEILKSSHCPVIITPHPGEMAGLTKTTIAQVQNDRLGCASEFARKYNVITVLKGWRTIIALPDGRIHINPTGNPGMATAGSGDALTGIIASFAGQGMTPEDAAVAGVYFHGAAGDCAAIEKGRAGMTAGDIIAALPEVLG